MHLFCFNILIFCCLLHVSKPKVHLQEDGCIYRYGVVCFTCISISSLAGRRVLFILFVSDINKRGGRISVTVSVCSQNCQP